MTSIPLPASSTRCSAASGHSVTSPRSRRAKRAAQVPPLEGLSRGQNAALAKALAFDREGAHWHRVEKPCSPGSAAEHPPPRSRRCGAHRRAAIIALVAVLGLAYVVLEKLWLSRHSVVVQSGGPGGKTGGLCAPHCRRCLQSSAALDRRAALCKHERGPGAGILLRRNIRGADQRALACQCAAGRARTSAISFKGKDIDIGTIARKLNVGAVLEGSMRRSDSTVRITAELVNSISGFHIWSQNYDRDLRDILQLQTEIALAVAGALKVSLLGDVPRGWKSAGRVIRSLR